MAEALLDSNVVIAALVERHPHHLPSLPFLASRNAGRFGLSSTSHAEIYVNLTRPGGTFQWPPTEAWAALERVRGHTVLLGLTPPQAFDAIRIYASTGGVSARLFDFLIGQAAVTAGVRRIVTWNVGHMHSLFPDLDVVDPTQAIAPSGR